MTDETPEGWSLDEESFNDVAKTYKEYSHRYEGITYLPVFYFDWMYKLWARFMCKRHWHVFDECMSYYGDKPEHTLVCDACQLLVYIERIDKTYVGKKHEELPDDAIEVKVVES